MAFSSDNVPNPPKSCPDSDGRVSWWFPRISGSQGGSRALSVVVAQFCVSDSESRFLSRTEGTEKNHGWALRYTVTVYKWRRRVKFLAVKLRAENEKTFGFAEAYRKRERQFGMTRLNSAAYHSYRGTTTLIFHDPQQATGGSRGILGRRTLINLRSLTLFGRNVCPKRVLDLRPPLYGTEEALTPAPFFYVP